MQCLKKMARCDEVISHVRLRSAGGVIAVPIKDWMNVQEYVESAFGPSVVFGMHS